MRNIDSQKLRKLFESDGQFISSYLLLVINAAKPEHGGGLELQLEVLGQSSSHQTDSDSYIGEICMLYDV